MAQSFSLIPAKFTPGLILSFLRSKSIQLKVESSFFHYVINFSVATLHTRILRISTASFSFRGESGEICRPSNEISAPIYIQFEWA